MKKFFILPVAVLGIFLLTGCGKGSTLVCTNSNTEFGITMSMTAEVNFDKNDKATDVKVIMDVADETMANLMCSQLKDDTSTEGTKVTCDGKKVIMTAKNTEELGSDGTTREEIKKDLEDSGYTCK